MTGLECPTRNKTRRSRSEFVDRVLDMKTKRRLRPIEIAMLVVPLCALAFASWRLMNRPEIVVPPRYTLTDLGAVGRGGFFTDLNDRGELTGVWKANWNGSWAQVFYWKKGKFTLLKAWSRRPRLNNNGLVFGSYMFNKTNPHFMWKDGKFKKPAVWPRDFEIKDINDSGQKVGRKRNAIKYTDPPYTDHTILIHNGKIRDLTISDENTRPIKINNKGDVLIDSDTNVYFWSKGKSVLIASGDKELPALGEDINNNGVVIGATYNIQSSPKDIENWIWRNGQLSTLRPSRGVDGFLVYSINDHDHIVGQAQIVHSSGCEYQRCF